MSAAFFNFHPAMVARAIPQCWSVVDPFELTVLRADAATSALRAMCSSDSLHAAVSVLPSLRRAVERCAGFGRILTGANRELWTSLAPQLRAQGRTADQVAVAELWQACTALREHRGDGHVAALVTLGLSGLGAHLLAVGVSGVPVELLRDNRGWTEEQWAQGARELVRRGLLDADGTATARGRDLHRSLELMTDDLAADAYASLPDVAVAELYQALVGCAREVQRSGLLPFPNPMGLPPLGAP